MKAKIQSWLANNTKVASVVIVALLLTLFLVIVRAAGPHITFETESANIAGAVIKNSSAASGGKYVEFMASASGADYPGQPKPGTVLWGSSLKGAVDPWEKLEQPAGGNRVGIRRTFQPSWSRSRIDKMVSVAKEDVAVGRLPWVSIKPVAWADMANGSQDTIIDYMLTELDKVQGPVWLTVHHEPEGGGGNNRPDDPGGPAMHVAMNRHIRQRMTALGTDNIALSLILMAYTFNPNSIPAPPQENHRIPDLWWEDGIYDFFGIDHYRETGTLLTNHWDSVVTWAYSKGVDVAVGEWGTIENTKARMTEWYQNALDSHNMPGKARIVGLSYYDSYANAEGATDWQLTDLRLDAFRELLVKPTSVNWPDINW